MSPPLQANWLSPKVGLGISWTNADCQWWPVYKTFHRIGSCGNETIRPKRDLDTENMLSALEHVCRKQTWTLALRFFIRIWYMFLLSKYRKQLDLGLCTISILGNRIPLRIGEFRLKNVFGRKICRKSPPCSRILFARTEVVHRSKCDSPLHFDIWNISHIRIET